MATQTKTDRTWDLFELEGSVERWTEATRKAGQDYLKIYESAVERLADLEVKTASATKIPVVATIAETHAAVSREVAGAYVSAARDLLKA
jgi:hypothetical protein